LNRHSMPACLVININIFNDYKCVYTKLYFIITNVHTELKGQPWCESLSIYTITIFEESWTVGSLSHSDLIRFDKKLQ